MNNEFNIDNFIQEQAQVTEFKEVKPIEEEVKETAIPGDDFDIPEEQEEPVNEVAEKIKEVLPINPRKEAANYTVMVDMTQKLLFTSLNKGKAVKKIGGRDNWNKSISKLEDLEEKLITAKDLTPEERKNVNIVQRTLTKIKRLKLTEEEKELFLDALEGFVSENNYKMPPSVLLIIAIISMAAPRMSDLMID